MIALNGRSHHRHPHLQCRSPFHSFTGTFAFLLSVLFSWCDLSGMIPHAQGQNRTRQTTTNWIWASAQPGEHATFEFTKSFRVENDGTMAELCFSPCFSELQITLDGRRVGNASAYQGVTKTTIQQPLNAGIHHLTVHAIGVEGPSAFFAELMLNHRDQVKKIRTGHDWLAFTANALKKQERAPISLIDLGPIENVLTPPEQSHVGIDALDNYEQWKLALGDNAKNKGKAPSFVINRHFTIQELPFPETDGLDPGSWVSMTIDSQGRLIIARETSGLIRLKLSARGDQIESAEWINRDLKECRGLTFRGQDLYVNANNSRGLYRLRSDEDYFADPELVYASSGGVGHGRNDLAVGPDNLLYSIHGDSVDLPESAIDHTSPYRNAAKGIKTSEGHLLRINPDTGTVEILAAGLRNPYGLDFNAQGDCFTYDADAEHDMGAPWYRPTRILQLVTGGDFGWRGVTGSWPPYYPDHPDNAIPGIDIGKGSPTAVKFGTASNFPAKYRDGLFVLDWAYGRILLVNLFARGSGYRMTAETFLKGRPLNVTDLDFGNNGSMYLITGGRKTQSKLYRVQYTGNEHRKSESSDHQKQCDQFSAESRRTRRELESLLTQQIDSGQFRRAWTLLGNPDPWISHAAARVIERVPTSKWKDKALLETEPAIAVRAITCLVRSQDAKSSPEVIQRLTQLADSVDGMGFHMENIQCDALYAIQLALSQEQQRSPARNTELISVLSPMYPARSDSRPSDSPRPASETDHRLNYRKNAVLSELLATLGDKLMVSKTIPLLQQTASPEQRLHFLYAMRHVTAGWTPELRRRYFTHLAKAGSELGGAGLPDFLQRIRDDAMQHVPSEEKEAMTALFKPASTSGKNLVPPPQGQGAVVEDWTVDKILGGTPLTGNVRRGKQIFAAAACIQCHRFETDGQMIGPDLTAAMRRYSRRDLLQAILRPSEVIAENYRSVQILTEDGEVFTGQITRGVDYRSPVLRLATDPANPSQIVEIEKSRISSRKQSQVSWMPDGLLDTFTRQQIFDLIAYLESSP